VHFLMSLVLQNSETIFRGREWIGIIAGVLAAIMAANASWHLTDRLLAFRQRRLDED
jgi:hypothetical protein